MGIDDARKLSIVTRISLLEKFESQPPWLRFVLCAGMSVLVGVVDQITGPLLNLALIYLLPVSLAAWSLSRRLSLAVASTAWLSWFSFDWLWQRSDLSAVDFVWNGIARFLLFLSVTYIVSFLREFRSRGTALEKQLAVEDAMRSNDARYRQILEGFREVYMTVDASGIISFVSSNVFNLLGQTGIEVVGRRFTEFLEPQHRYAVLRAVVNARTTGSRDLQLEFRYRLSAQQLLWIGASVRLQHDSLGAIVGYHAILNDITSRVLATHQLDLVGNALRSSTELICITDRSNRFIFVNDAFQRAYGYSAEEVMGRDPSMLLAPHVERETVTRVLESTKKEGWLGVLMNKRKDGSVFPVYLNTSKVFDRTGKLIGYVGISRDVSDEVRAQQAIASAHGKLSKLFHIRQESNTPDRSDQNIDGALQFADVQTISRNLETIILQLEENISHILSFTTLAAHELRNPLAVIRQNLEAALHVGTKEAGLRSTLIATHNDIMRMSHIVGELLTVARMRSGVLELKKDPVQLHRLISEIGEEFSVLCRPKGVSLRVDHVEEAITLGEEAFLRQVFLNLMDNALRFSPPGGTIIIRQDRRDGWAEITIEDEGPGISETEFSSIFDPFFRGKQPHDSTGSHSGLGLTFSKWVVEALGGTIHATNCSSEKGARLCLRLPIIS